MALAPIKMANLFKLSNREVCYWGPEKNVEMMVSLLLCLLTDYNER